MDVRIAGVTLPKEKRVVIALSSIYGIGKPLAEKIVRIGNIDPSIRTKNLTEQQANTLREIIEKGGYAIEGDLRREILMNIKRLKEIGSYRGTRHTKHLPARGQRTKTNTRTVRGNIRRTMGSGRKSSSEKT